MTRTLLCVLSSLLVATTPAFAWNNPPPKPKQIHHMKHVVHHVSKYHHMPKMVYHHHMMKPPPMMHHHYMHMVHVPKPPVPPVTPPTTPPTVTPPTTPPATTPTQTATPRSYPAHHGGGGTAPGWLSGTASSIIVTAFVLAAYDIQRRWTCSGDYLGLGGPGFGEPMPATGNIKPPPVCGKIVKRRNVVSVRG